MCVKWKEKIADFFLPLHTHRAILKNINLAWLWLPPPRFRFANVITQDANSLHLQLHHITWLELFAMFSPAASSHCTRSEQFSGPDGLPFGCVGDQLLYLPRQISAAATRP